MRVLGIDCGGEYTGYGVVEQNGEGVLHHLCSGAIRLSSREPLELRLKKICEGLTEIIRAYSPEEVAIEDVFYAVNVKSALKLGHVRGVAMLAAAQAGLEVVAYSPAVDQVGSSGIRQGGEVAGADDGGAPAGTARAAEASRCSRRPGHCHLPSAHRRNVATATGGRAVNGAQIG